MPEIGEIRKGTEVGFKTKDKVIWAACVVCGKPRWNHLIVKDAAPQRLRCASCYFKSKRGGNSPYWKGGRFITDDGYIRVLVYPDDFFYPMANKKGYVLEHRLVVAKALNRCLLPWEVVHHKGKKFPQGSVENKQDNRYPENLELLPAPGKHNTILERELKRQAKLIEELQARITLLEAENILLKEQIKDYSFL